MNSQVSLVSTNAADKVFKRLWVFEEKGCENAVFFLVLFTISKRYDI